MALSRRDFLRLAGLVAAGAAVSACAPVYARLAAEPEPLAGAFSSGDLEDRTVFAALNRLTFGPRLEERQRAAEIGLKAWIEEQLAPGALDDTATDSCLRRFETLKMSAAELVDWSDKLFDGQDKSTVPNELRQATLLRQVYSRRQLYEVMVEFWSDHFNISVDKGDCWFLKTVDDREVIRPHALGKFHDLLWASAHSPAMLTYLDNQVNHRGAPNENYARELMELHTLGVQGGYTQTDVMELARTLTGWTVKEHFWRGDFTFKAEMHEAGIKTVLGRTLEPEGQREAERALEMLAAHPATTQYIAAKLARRFVADDPPDEIVARAADVFARTEGDIRAVLRVILLDGPANAEAKYKRPVNFVVSALRLLNAQTDGGEALHMYLARMGQPCFAWPTPDGYPDRAEAWRGNLMPRWHFALSLAQNEIAGTQINLPELGRRPNVDVVDQLSWLLLGAPLSPTTRDSLLDAIHAAGADEESHWPAIITAGLVASPAFQWR